MRELPRSTVGRRPGERIGPDLDMHPAGGPAASGEVGHPRHLPGAAGAWEETVREQAEARHASAAARAGVHAAGQRNVPTAEAAEAAADAEQRDCHAGGPRQMSPVQRNRDRTVLPNRDGRRRPARPKRLAAAVTLKLPVAAALEAAQAMERTDRPAPCRLCGSRRAPRRWHLPRCCSCGRGTGRKGKARRHARPLRSGSVLEAADALRVGRGGARVFRAHARLPDEVRGPDEVCVPAVLVRSAAQ